MRLSLSVREVSCPSPARSNALVKLSVLEIPLDRELTANCLVETRTKLEELVPAAMVYYGLNRVQRPLRLQQSLIKWFLMVWFTLGQSGQRTSVKCTEAVWNTKQGA